MIKGVHHVAIAVRSIEEALGFYVETLGLEASPVTTLADQGVRAALIDLGVGEIELIEPTDPQGGVARFLERRGEGLHHICLQVDDVDAELKALAARGVELIDREGRPGLAGRIGFVHPRSAKGVLIELAQGDE